MPKDQYVSANVDWQKRRLEVYRRLETTLVLAATLYETDPLESALLPGFRCQINQLFDEIEPLAH